MVAGGEGPRQLPLRAGSAGRRASNNNEQELRGERQQFTCSAPLRRTLSSKRLKIVDNNKWLYRSPGRSNEAPQAEAAWRWPTRRNICHISTSCRRLASLGAATRTKGGPVAPNCCKDPTQEARLHRNLAIARQQVVQAARTSRDQHEARPRCRSAASGKLEHTSRALANWDRAELSRAPPRDSQLLSWAGENEKCKLQALNTRRRLENNIIFHCVPPPNQRAPGAPLAGAGRGL